MLCEESQIVIYTVKYSVQLLRTSSTSKEPVKIPNSAIAVSACLTRVNAIKATFRVRHF